MFGTTSELFNAALQADNIAFDSDSVIQGYGLNDTDSGNFVFSFDLVYLDTTEETVDFIFFARSDYALPQTGEGVVVQFLSFPVVSTGGSGTSPLNTALGVRVIGNIGDVKDTMLEMLPAGSTGNWIESNMGDWHFEIVSDGDTHSVNIYLGSNLMGTW